MIIIRRSYPDLVRTIAGLAIELDQPQLDFRMPGRHLDLAGAERLHQQVRALCGHVEKILLARRLVMGRRRLVHLAQIIELVAHRFF